MRILADANITDVERQFGAFGDVVLFDGRQLARADIAEGDVLLVRSVTPVDGAFLACAQPAFVGSATSGTDHLELAGLEARGIPWACAPGSNARSVAEYVFAAIAEVDDLLERLFDGGSMGIIGYGDIGQACGRLAKAFKMNIIALRRNTQLFEPPDLAAEGSGGGNRFDLHGRLSKSRPSECSCLRASGRRPG